MVCTLGAEVDRHVDSFFGWLYEIQDQVYDNWFGYVSNRPNRNAGMPMHLMKAKKLIPLWRSYALVSYSEMTTRMFAPERKSLAGRKVEIFDNLLEAMQWTDGVIRNLRASEGPADPTILSD